MPGPSRARWRPSRRGGSIQGDGECFVETGDGQAALGSGNFYAEPVPQVTLHASDPRWHAAKVEWERDFLARWL